MAEPNAGLYRTLSVADCTSAPLRHEASPPRIRLAAVLSHTGRVICFGVHIRVMLMFLKPDCVDILETVKWIALWTITMFAFDYLSDNVTVNSVL